MPYGFVPPPSEGVSGGGPSPPFSGADVVGGHLVDSDTQIRDDGDPSRRLLFELAGTTGTVVLTPPAAAGTYAIATGSNWNPAAAEVVTNKDLSDASNDVSGATASSLTNASGAAITLPTGAGARTLATLSGAETLTSKTLTAPVIASITSGAVAQTLPSGTAGMLVNTTQAQTFTTGVKTFSTGALALRNPLDTFSATVDAGAQTAARTFTLPVSGGDTTFVMTTVAQTLTNKTLTAPVIASITSGAVSQTVPSVTAGELVNTTQAQTLESKTLTTPVIASITSGAVAQTVPSVTAGELVNTTQAQTLENKTLDTPNISQISSFVIQQVPSAVAGTLINTTQTQTFTTGAKTFQDGLLRLRNPLNNFSATVATLDQTGDRTVRLPVTIGDDTFVLAGTASTVSGAHTHLTNTMLLRNPANTFSATLNAGAQTAARTFTLPVANTGTIVIDTATQTLTNKTLTAPTISGAALIADSSFFRDNLDNTKRLAFQLSGLPTATTVTYTATNASGAIVVDVAAQTLTNKTLQDSTTAIADNADATKLARFECSGIATGTTRTYTLPDVSSTVLTATPAATSTVDVGSAALRYRNAYFTDSVQVSKAVPFSTSYDLSALEIRNTNDTAGWVAGLRTASAGDSRLGFRYNISARGFFSGTGPDTQVNQTMQHHLLMETPADLSRVGLLFKRVDGAVSTFTSRAPGTVLTGQAGIIVDDALPVMRLCPAARNVKGLYGVLCRPAPREWYGAAVGLELDDVPDIDSRGLFATQGEGAMWVLAPVVSGAVPACHHIELGDFLSSCGLAAGYAGRQMSQADATVDDADSHYAWSAARAGFSCDYDLASATYTCENVTLDGVDYRRAFIPVGFCM